MRGQTCITWARHRSTSQFGIVAGALGNESAHASPVIGGGAGGEEEEGLYLRLETRAGRACITRARHHSTYHVGIVACALSNESERGLQKLEGWGMMRGVIK